MFETSLKNTALIVACVFAGIAGGLLAPSAAAGVQQLSVTSCASISACISGSNTSTGPGVQGVSARGRGVVGQTKFNSTSPSNAQFGVLGQDLSTTSRTDEGVRGTSVRGIGVHGIGQLGLYGFGMSGPGVAGEANNAGTSDFFAFGTHGENFISGYSNGTQLAFNVFNDGFISAKAISVSNADNGGNGVFGDGAFAGVYASNSNNAPNSAAFYAEGHGGKLYVGKGSAGGPVFEVDDAVTLWRIASPRGLQQHRQL